LTKVFFDKFIEVIKRTADPSASCAFNKLNLLSCYCINEFDFGSIQFYSPEGIFELNQTQFIQMSKTANPKLNTCTFLVSFSSLIGDYVGVLGLGFMRGYYIAFDMEN
jgi:hypothetical protein